MPPTEQTSLGWLISEHANLVWALRERVGLGCGSAVIKHYEAQIATVRELLREATTIRCPHCGHVLADDHYGQDRT